MGNILLKVMALQSTRLKMDKRGEICTENIGLFMTRVVRHGIDISCFQYDTLGGILQRTTKVIFPGPPNKAFVGLDPIWFYACNMSLIDCSTFELPNILASLSVITSTLTLNTTSAFALSSAA